jgi:hypothetical protein
MKNNILIIDDLLLSTKKLESNKIFYLKIKQISTRNNIGIISETYNESVKYLVDKVKSYRK